MVAQQYSNGNTLCPLILVKQARIWGGTNMVNLLSFHPYKSGFPVTQSIGVGKNTYNPQDYKDEWEFIRRYMEEGPNNLPKLRLSTHLPMPLHGLNGHISPMIYIAKK